MKNADLPAMPLTSEPYPSGALRTDLGQFMSGLTKREHFAAMAMQGFCVMADNNDRTEEQIAKWSVLQADALLAQLAKPTGVNDSE